MNDLPLFLFAFANNRDEYLDFLKEEARSIRKIFQDLELRNLCKLVILENADSDDIYNEIVKFQNQLTLFHFGGHANGNSLLLDDGGGSVKGVCGLLKNAPNLELIVLNGCNTADQIELLLNSGIKRVIATSAKIGDNIAVNFAEKFYTSLVNQHSIGVSFANAMSGLKLKDEPILRNFGSLENINQDSPVWGIYPENVEMDWKISEKLVSIETTSKEEVSQPLFFNVPLDPNPYFTGREELLKELHETLHKKSELALNSAPKARALSGMGGVGKTQTAIQYAYNYKSDYSAIFWVLADEKLTLRNQYANLSELMGYKIQKIEDKIEAVKDWLKKNKNWLLIFDNAETIELITAVKNLLPKGHEGHILYTTRAQSTGDVESVSVDCFDVETGSVFLLRRSRKIDLSVLMVSDIKEKVGSDTWNLSEEIVKELGGLALAIDQAGAYIDQTGCSFQEYKNLFQTDAIRMLKERDYVQDADHPDAVYKTFILAIEKAEKRNPLTKTILENIAFGHPDGIPKSLFDDIDLFELNQALKVLKDYSLINIIEKQNLFTIHRLVQMVIKDVYI